MGAVHRVRDTSLLRDVALKMLAPALASEPQYRRQFLAEAQIQAQLDHPGIVPVHDLTMEGSGTSYFIMRLVRGRTLADWIDEVRNLPSAPETLEEMLGVFLKVCDVVAFAHSRGVLHLDIKPENIIVGDFGAVYLTDWGLARLCNQAIEAPEAVKISPEAAAGVASGVVGSPSYMSPEQALGALGMVSERTDVFGLGAVLYSILTGRPLYVADSLNEVLEKARGGEVPPLRDSSLREPPPERLCEIAHKALATEPAQRYASVLDLKGEVEAFVHGGVTFTLTSFAPGEVIISEGDQGDAVFVILQGRCALYRSGAERGGTELGPGAIFGEEALSASCARRATVQALTPVTVRAVTRKGLMQAQGRDSWFGSFLMALGERIRDLRAPAKPDDAA